MPNVGATNGNIPSAGLQPPWQRGKMQGSTAQGDAPSQTFTAAPPQQANPTASAPTAASSGSKTGGGSVGAFPRFEPQTLQTLLDVQARNS